MKLASIGFVFEKKNPDGTFKGTLKEFGLIPASFFLKTTDTIGAGPAGRPASHTSEKPSRVKTSAPPHTEKAAPQSPIPSTSPESREESETLVAVSEPIRKIRIKERSQRVSGLSLSSLKAKKAFKAKQAESTEEEDLPNKEFTEAAMQACWAEFVKKLEQEGRKILASSLNTEVPVLHPPHTISLELPNGTMKKEIEREQGELVAFLKKHLNHHGIQIKITVNEETAKRFAYTPEEKYQKLREKNPAIDLLRKEFDLEL